MAGLIVAAEVLTNIVGKTKQRITKKLSILDYTKKEIGEALDDMLVIFSQELLTNRKNVQETQAIQEKRTKLRKFKRIRA